MMKNVNERSKKVSKRSGQRGPREVTEKRLNNVALHYVSRYSATTDSLRKVLMRRVEASARVHGTDPKDGAIWTETLIIKFQALGYLNDRAYAANRARSLLARGNSMRAVAMKLREKGISVEDIEVAFEAAREDISDLDLAAAAALARRRRLGPYRLDVAREEHRDRDLAALARAGFSYDVARCIIEAKTVNILEAIISGKPEDNRLQGPDKGAYE